MSHKTFHYRIYPTKKQETTLTHWLQLLCETYNAALQERRDAYRMAGKSIGFSHQCAELPECRQMRPDLAEVPSQVLQDAVKRVDLAFDRFFQRCASGEKPGYPRYKSHVRYDSMTFKQYGNSFDVAASSQKNRGTLVLAKLGQVKMVMHRTLAGTPKTAIVKRTPTGKWFVSISCEDAPKGNVPQSDKEVGIDVGLKTFAYLSDGTSLENPRFFRQEEKNLAKAQRKRDKAPKQSQERKKLKKRVARVHERTKNRRKNFAHQHSRKIVNTCNLIAVEALIVRNMVKNPKLSRIHRRCSVVAVLCVSVQQSGRSWPHSGQSQPSLHQSAMFLLRACARDAALRTDLRMSQLWTRDRSRPQWQQKYFR